MTTKKHILDQSGRAGVLRPFSSRDEQEIARDAESLRQERDSLSAELLELNARLKILLKELDAPKSGLSALKAETERNKKELETIQREIQRCAEGLSLERFDDLQESYERLDAEVHELREQKDELDRLIAENEKNLGEEMSVIGKHETLRKTLLDGIQILGRVTAVLEQVDKNAGKRIPAGELTNFASGLESRRDAACTEAAELAVNFRKQYGETDPETVTMTTLCRLLQATTGYEQSEHNTEQLREQEQSLLQKLTERRKEHETIRERNLSDRQKMQALEQETKNLQDHVASLRGELERRDHEAAKAAATSAEFVRLSVLAATQSTRIREAGKKMRVLAGMTRAVR